MGVVWCVVLISCLYIPHRDRTVTLGFSGIVFSSSEVAPSIQQVDQTFGATHPGIYDRERHLFLLNFRGLTFYFPVEPKFEVTWINSINTIVLFSQYCQEA